MHQWRLIWILSRKEEVEKEKTIVIRCSGGSNNDGTEEVNFVFINTYVNSWREVFFKNSPVFHNLFVEGSVCSGFISIGWLVVIVVVVGGISYGVKLWVDMPLGFFRHSSIRSEKSL